MIYSFCWIILPLIQILPRAENTGLKENQNFKARSDPKECLLQWFAHMGNNRIFWEVSLKYSESRASTSASLFQLVVGGAQVCKSGLKPLSYSNFLIRDVEIAA